MAKRRAIYSYFSILNTAGTYIWYKPYNAKIIKVQLWGAGGGGQGARGHINSYNATPGVGGQGGSCIIRYIDAAMLGRTTTLIVGAPGQGGSAGGGPFANPPGTNGGNTSFGSLIAYGGVANADAAQTGTGGPGLPSYFSNHALGGAMGYQPTAGWCSVFGGGQWGSASAIFGGAAGGTGGGASPGSESPGVDGGIRGYYYTGGGGAGAPIRTNAASVVGTWKGGGGGGGNGTAGQGGRGGNGGYACGGGGGGGGYSGGGGGTGGPGYAIITVYW
jgi:hypothetical protein